MKDCEIELLCACTRATLGRSDEAHIRTLLADADVDWVRFLHLAEAHGVDPIIEPNLSAVSSRVPRSILGRFAANRRRTALRNLFHTHELVRLIERFRERGIPVLPFKGPVLGHLLYGDVSRRPFGDLDVLIRKADWMRVEAMLDELGYVPYRQFEGRVKKRHVDSQMGIEWIGMRGTVILELHWGLINGVHACRFDMQKFWERSIPADLMLFAADGHIPAIRRFSDEDLLIYLCVHGSVSFWSRLVWVCDIAELVKQSPTLDWELVIREARASHVTRMVLLGLELAHRLMRTPLPARVHELNKTDSAIADLAEKVIERLGRAEPMDGVEKVRFHLAMRGRRRDRLPYFAHLLRHMWKPTEKDVTFIHLPHQLRFLYLIVRALRLFRERVLRGAEGERSVTNRALQE